MSVAVILVTFVSLLFVGIAADPDAGVQGEVRWYDRSRSRSTCAILARPELQRDRGDRSAVDAVRQAASAEDDPTWQPSRGQEEAYENWKRLNGNDALTQFSGHAQFAFVSVSEQYSVVKERDRRLRSAVSVEVVNPLFRVGCRPHGRPGDSVQSGRRRGPADLDDDPPGEPRAKPRLCASWCLEPDVQAPFMIEG